MQLAKRLKAIKPSPTLSLNAKAKALAAKGEEDKAISVRYDDKRQDYVVRLAKNQIITRFKLSIKKSFLSSGLKEKKSARVRNALEKVGPGRVILVFEIGPIIETRTLQLFIVE